MGKVVDRPIIFSAAMVRALIAGSKTMTRRLAWRFSDVNDNHTKAPTLWQKIKPGDRLYVRENLAVMGNWGVWHDASDPPRHGQFLDDIDPRGRAILERYAPTEATDSARVPSIHMPKWASRLTLVVTGKKIERVQDIDEDDAKAEGVKPVLAGVSVDGPLKTYRTGFVRIWRELHGEDSWLSNPEVVCLSFKVHQKNIDAMQEAA